MTLRRYILVETVISMAINVVLSVIFALTFFGTDHVDLGAHATWLDMAPQSFMIALMATLVPTLLTRQRVASGALPVAIAPEINAVIVAVGTAAAAAVVGLALYILLIPATTIPAWLFVAGKAIYGAALAAVVTPIALRRVLRG